jgi:hypothetical protein
VSRRSWWLCVVLAPVAGLQLVAMASYLGEQRTLESYLNRVTQASQAPSEQAKEIVLSLKNKPDEGNDSYFLLPIFRPLRPTASQVIESGGDCADRSRLVITLLNLRGIHATKWALYNAKGESKHAVVEADVETGKMVLDPLFGIWFPKPQGGYFAIRELRQDPNILLDRLKELRAEKVNQGAGRLEFYPTTDYIYANARTINWTKTATMRDTFSVLHRMMGERADALHRPGFVEEPALMVIYGLAVLEVFLILLWLVMRRLTKKRTAEGSFPGSTKTRDTRSFPTAPLERSS